MKWMLTTLLFGSAILLSLSRGPWIAVVLVCVAAIFTTRSRRRWHVLGLMMLLMGLALAAPRLRARSMSIVDREHQNNSERFHMWRAGVEMWKSHPLLGVGPGNSKPLSLNFMTPEERSTGPWGHLHSIYVHFLAERGALGLLALLGFIGAFFLEMRIAMRRNQDDPQEAAVYQGAMLGIIAFLVSGITETSYNTAIVNMTLYFVVGLALARARHEG